VSLRFFFSCCYLLDFGFLVVGSSGLGAPSDL
jgi:hypothetical protein